MATPLFAQSGEELLDRDLSLNAGTENVQWGEGQGFAFSAEVAGSSDKVLKEWKRFLRKKYGVSLKRKEGYFSADEAYVKTVAPEAMTVYTKVIATGGKTTIYWSAKDKEGRFVNGEMLASRAEGMRAVQSSFARTFYHKSLDKVFSKAARQQKQVNRTVRKEEKAVASQARIIDRNTTKINRNLKAIEKAQAKIEDMTEDNTKRESTNQEANTEKEVHEQALRTVREEAGQQDDFLKKIEAKLKEVDAL